MISTHILDLELGRPASGIKVKLEKKNADSWVLVNELQTDLDGRISFANSPEAGVYRLNFQVAEYFKQQSKSTFFTEVPVCFEITDTGRKYHVPLLLNTFGYSTYRGS